MVEKGTGHKLKGGEYTSNQFQEYLQSEGIKHERTIPKTPATKRCYRMLKPNTYVSHNDNSSQSQPAVKPNVSHLRTFGCVVYAHVPKDERCILMGYGTNVKGYRLYDPVSGKMQYSRDCKFITMHLESHGLLRSASLPLVLTLSKNKRH